MLELVAAGAAALAAGAVNALAGGGSLISFPALVALGVPPVVANLTNTVALCPGYVGAAWAQRGDLAGQGGRLALLVPAGALGGLGGALVLLHTRPGVFTAVVPFLLLAAAALIAGQDALRRRLFAGRARGAEPRRHDAHGARGAVAIAPIAVAAIYGGYFGAGLGVITLAVLGLVFDEPLARLNALKQTLSLAINASAAAVFALTAPVRWPIAGAMAIGALGGGVLGGRLAGRVRAGVLRALVVAIATAVAAVYLVRLVG